jgi:ParB family chromosome partitioning protein
MSKTKPRQPRLGRGLSSLMTNPVAVQPPEVPPELGRGEQDGEAVRQPGRELTYLSLDRIKPNPHQPRQRFNQAALDRLAASIQTEGVMQPIVVRPGKGGNQYEIVAGERRWRAGQIAGIDAIPAIIRELDDRQIAEWALIENLQREDLNPIERAEAFQRLADRYELSHDQIAQRVGVDRSTISNTLRLLNLTDEVQQLVREGLLAAGHARALVTLSDPKQQTHLAQRIVREGLSTRQVEAAAKQFTASGDGAANGQTAPTPVAPRAAHLADLERQISSQLGMKTRLQSGRKKGAGKITIQFQSLEQFDDLMGRLGIETA